VSAQRNGDSVTISSTAATPALELGYLVEGIFCNGSHAFAYAIHTTNTSMQITDASNCSQNSYGTIRVVNKLGYSNSVNIPWP